MRDCSRRVQPNVKRMAHKKPDRRTERTRHALMMAFVDLVLTRGYFEINVDDIVEKANIGRSTFYMHYKSKDDLLRASITRPSTPLSLVVGYDIPTEIIIGQLNHFYEQRTRNGTFFVDPIRKIWVKCLAGMIEPRLTTLVRQVRARPVLPLNLIATQIAESQIALITNWLLSRPPAKVEAVAQGLIGGTRAMLAAFLGTTPDASLFIAGEKLKFIRV